MMMKVLLIGLGVVGLALGAREAVQSCCAVPSRTAEQTIQGGVTSVFKVEGMTCGGCEASVRRVVGKLEGVKEVKASYEKGEAIVVYDPARVTTEQISKAIQKLGYKAELVKEKETARK